jgi:hypothetical protein
MGLLIHHLHTSTSPIDEGMGERSALFGAGLSAYRHGFQFRPRNTPEEKRDKHNDPNNQEHCNII